MNKIKLIISVDVVLLLIITLIIVSRTDKINRETAQVELEQALVKIPITQPIDVSTVKDTIENDVDNSKVVNKNSTTFPVYTVVDGYGFKIGENNGTLEVISESNIKEENINNTPPEDVNNVSNEITNTIPKENINIISDNISTEVDEPTSLVKYANEKKTDKGITISTTDDGTVTISGKSTGKLFIKISNNIQISDNANSFDIWENEERNSS